MSFHIICFLQMSGDPHPSVLIWGWNIKKPFGPSAYGPGLPSSEPYSDRTWTWSLCMIPPTIKICRFGGREGLPSFYLENSSMSRQAPCTSCPASIPYTVGKRRPRFSQYSMLVNSHSVSLSFFLMRLLSVPILCLRSSNLEFVWFNFYWE